MHLLKWKHLLIKIGFANSRKEKEIRKRNEKKIIKHCIVMTLKGSIDVFQYIYVYKLPGSLYCPYIPGKENKLIL